MDFFKSTKAVTFDVGYTIISPAEPVGISYQRHLANHGINIASELLETSFFSSWEDHVRNSEGLLYGTTEEEATATWANLLHNMLQKTVGKSDAKTVKAVSGAIFREFSTSAAWSIHPHWERIIDFCRRQNWKIGLVSNWDVRLSTLLTDLGISEQVDFQIISAECGIEKPHEDIFFLATTEVGCNIGEIVHVGDTLVDDVWGAVNAGAKSIWCNHRNQTPTSKFHECGEKAMLINDLAEFIRA